MTSQPLPPCHRHPRRRCPGECQYILPHGECWHDQPTALQVIGAKIKTANQVVIDPLRDIIDAALCPKEISPWPN